VQLAITKSSAVVFSAWAGIKKVQLALAQSFV